MTKGTVFNIQKFSINDGPGIRTTVFLKGCPLSCIWCHNPESKKTSPEIFYNPSKCVGCGKCTAVCEKNGHKIANGTHEYTRVVCDGCGRCAEACVTGALELCGKKMSADEVIAEVMKDEIFYETSGGGLTVSGGEPMAQFDFTYELLTLAKEKGLHVCMETCGFAPSEKYKKIAPLVDIFLFDYKETDAALHKSFTGVSNELILENLTMLDSIGVKTILRCPIIPTCNDRDDHFEGIARVASSLNNIIEINVEPYHPLGKGKSELLDRRYVLDDVGFPSDETVSGWIDKTQSKTAVIVKKA